MGQRKQALLCWANTAGREGTGAAGYYRLKQHHDGAIYGRRKRETRCLVQFDPSLSSPSSHSDSHSATPFDPDDGADGGIGDRIHPSARTGSSR